MLPIYYISTISRFLDSSAIGTGGTTLVMDGLQVNNISLPPSAIQEVKINQNPYSPEFLRPGRGRIEVVTKAGASDYHGSFNFVFRDNRFNAREPFAATKPEEQRRILESSLTGPIGSGKIQFTNSGAAYAARIVSLAPLHRRQRSCQFHPPGGSPPKRHGTTWSRVSSLVPSLNCVPQTAQRDPCL